MVGKISSASARTEHRALSCRSYRVHDQLLGLTSFRPRAGGRKARQAFHQAARIIKNDVIKKYQRSNQSHITSSNTVDNIHSTHSETLHAHATAMDIDAVQLNDKDRESATILATLYLHGLIGVQEKEQGHLTVTNTAKDEERDTTSAPASPSHPFSPLQHVPVTDVALPSMSQTSIMLANWHCEDGLSAVADAAVFCGGLPLTPPRCYDGDVSSPPSLSASSTRSASPDVPPTPALSVSARSSLSIEPASPKCHEFAFRAWTRNLSRSPEAPSTGNGHPPAHLFNTYSPSYCALDSASVAGMPSPPQSPKGHCFAETKPQLRMQQTQLRQTQQPRQLQLPSPPQPAPMFTQQPQQLPPHQQALPASSSDAISTTVLTLPFADAASAGHHHTTLMPPTLVSPLALRRRRSSGSSTACVKKVSPRSPRAPRTPPSTAAALSRPHCNVKYETAELDFIMYQRTTMNRAWDDVTAAFNAALPRLQDYLEVRNRANMGADGSASVGTNASPESKAQRETTVRPRPERTTPGLQASYYRQRLALPLLDAQGRLVFDEPTGKQMFTEVMVRDDKSRKKQQQQRRLPGSTAMSTSTPTTFNPEDTRVHLVLYFPERVLYYDYWFVSNEDKTLARQIVHERNVQRSQRNLPAWQPFNDFPESGILIRAKDTA